MDVPELAVGVRYSCWKDIEETLEKYERRHFVELYKRSAISIDEYKVSAKRHRNADIRAEMKYGRIIYCCRHGGKKFVSSAKPIDDKGRPNQK